MSSDQASTIVASMLTRLNLPPELPITDRREEIVEAIRDNQVVIVAGETGSGKSTQLPKLCLEAGCGVNGRIGHTQPRRLAARSVAERIASEMQTTVGEEIGFAFRFNDQVKPSTRIKLMTDGILLAEVQRDRSLRQYDTLIIDEAHERSLNIDFILGYLHQLLPRRPDLKVIITSATIDTDRFSKHFDDAPVIEVSGRTFPVELRYQENLDDLSSTDQICAAVRELVNHGPGDILVFLPGERDIRDTAEALAEGDSEGVDPFRGEDVEIFPLFARLSSSEQHRVFSSHNKRRVVLATNVAETSVTVPGIRFVVDPGTARISRYSVRTKVQRLPIEAVSQASANQRAGRCGRVGPGVCIRLYSEDDFDSRYEFTEPEIKRTNLASVILQMAALGLGDVTTFPFVEPPEKRNITDGIQLLEELGALDPDKQGTKSWLTGTGRELARLPVDPRFGRMILEAADNGALHEVTVIVAALSVQDPRERPTDQQQAASESHARFAHENSDFLTLLNLWNYLDTERRKRGTNQFRKKCRREFLHYNRIREWQDIYSQIARTTKELGYRQSGNTPSPDTIHQSLLAGLLSHIGFKDQKSTRKSNDKRDKQSRSNIEFVGARNTKFAIGRSSVLKKQPPSWVMAAELIETNRLWAGVVAPIDPAWVERLCGHVATYTYTDPDWDPQQGTAVTRERVTLYGMTLAANRQVTVGSINPALGRELFIHHALVLNEWEENHQFTKHGFSQHNADLIADVEELETRARRRDLMKELNIRHQFFDERIPADVSSAAHFNKWWKAEKLKTPELLNLSVGDIVDTESTTVDEDQYPSTWPVDGFDLELAYEFDSGSDLDGLSVHVPVEVLNQLDARPFEWLVPGLRRELVDTLTRSLPKTKRKALLPISEAIETVMDRLDQAEGSLTTQLASELGRHGAISIDSKDFDLSRLPAHLRATFRVITDERELLAEGKDLQALQTLMANQVRSRLAEVAEQAIASDIERDSLSTWDFEALPKILETSVDGLPIRAFPCLVDEDGTVAIRLFGTDAEQADAMWTGTRRLLRLQLKSPVRNLDAMLSSSTKLNLATGIVQSKSQWYNDTIDCVVDDAIACNGGPAWNRKDFESLQLATSNLFTDKLQVAADHMEKLVAACAKTQSAMSSLGAKADSPSVRDAASHFKRLAYVGMMVGVGFDRLEDVTRYVRGVAYRIEALSKNDQRDVLNAADCVRLEQRHHELINELGLTEELEALTWQLEELRLALFAAPLRDSQSPGTRTKVSVARVEKQLSALG